MQMADKPYDCDRERGEKKQKNNPAFPSLFAKATRPSNAAASIEGLSTLQRY
jgi:hypothetical protein